MMVDARAGVGRHTGTPRPVSGPMSARCGAVAFDIDTRTEPSWSSTLRLPIFATRSAAPPGWTAGDP